VACALNPKNYKEPTASAPVQTTQTEKKEEENEEKEKEKEEKETEEEKKEKELTAFIQSILPQDEVKENESWEEYEDQGKDGFFHCFVLFCQLI
jgi:hypothetical protein